MLERFSRSARVAVVLAQEEARELKADEIRPEHVLVGVLQSAGSDLASLLAGYGLTADAVRERLVPDESGDKLFDDDAEALRSIGIDLRAVRDSVANTFGDDVWDNALRRSGRRRRRRGRIPFTRSSKKVLELALREALAHNDKTIGCEHVLLGILRGGGKYARTLISEHVDPVQLRRPIIELLDEAA
jgi:ATP-dependent Clp protease ATP-binding subunit ClpA